MTRAPYAADPTASRGREFLENRDSTRGPRSEFQRDRDRIIHSISFRRLRSKTQVFIAPDGDHYRTRLTHSLEVAQIGRVIARTLGLDEDLTEALCLAHDIGHPPFGHAGEKALSLAMEKHGGFDHNAQSLRTLMRLESPYCDHEGLNLTWELLEGLAKHNGPVEEPSWALAELDADYPLALRKHPSLEAQVAAIADDIAYDNHDIDDGLRAGFIDLDELLTLDFVADQWRMVEKRFPGAQRERQLRELVRGQIGLMVNDVIEHTRKAVSGIETLDDVHGAGKMLATFSPGFAQSERKLKNFMYEKLYYHPEQLSTAEKARDVVSRIYAAYEQDASLLPHDWHATLPESEPARSRHVADYIAGMTDRYAIDQCARIYGSAPAGLSNV
ncbi:deoxyguanosinetriphosphate triphosphohydrolase [Pontixanthobacter aestiaquae]|uniref:Deoxyguanosinetriphosphate triphosphohydrolase-like protein n=1 Tax=Pontixanthobacter aestiaquae TaxID=1509367 RepID=A0A844Z764_9SPHN|nr:deoxyguanosinetriphosphate triphosphohydrolase [Pontixanthobacter aestiaquae]MDN3645910.1 deoxyguanosinetriphosphate triphosphohydrolase [Pontixanthobacter aestiaquae]MXO83096.1 deoxyguanosinetriphosphate triphosphohydrolase [Pontixanthobacter aestiaquae]